jgi:hypothetical protein
VQRFAHPHEHDVGSCPQAADPLPQRQDLADDLVRLQVALETHERGLAEHAVERAPDLRRDAERDAPIGRHEHGLDRASFGKREEVLAGSVDPAILPGNDGQRPEIEVPGELGAEPRREVRHLLEGLGALVVEPVRDLPEAVLGETPLLDLGPELLEAEPPDVPPERNGCDSGVHGRRLPPRLRAERADSILEPRSSG